MTEEEITRTYASTMDSVTLLNQGMPLGMTEADWGDAVRRNVEHLKTMVSQDYWNGQDLKPINEAIAAFDEDWTAPATKIPKTVSMAQARIALIKAGKFDAVESGIAELDEPAKTVATIAWEYSANVSRNGALIKTLSGEFGFTEKQLDELFIAAAAIKI